MGKLLLIVSQDRPDLYNYITWHFSSEKEVQVILERRGAERRRRVEGHAAERRYADRRRKRRDRDPLSLNHVIARRIEEEMEPAVDALLAGAQSAALRPKRNGKTLWQPLFSQASRL